ncbi:von Willebrand factor type A domain protein [Devosia sp. LC5]|uniref:vWA domain-containing protein n=1 Tax=Devosia sp. LC5 TaxID=1502724 RepID=UPI0004E31996|nr:VWA domain-containing protein [Devosia sp. LC5]KFC62445.1 von Willebrand factor type A domain protein [Devosia sp. LC5]
MSDDMHDPFTGLSQAKAPAGNAEAKKRALAAGMAAFEAMQAETAQKSAEATQGNRKGGRLSSIITTLKGNWIMDMRLPIGTAAIALLVLPLGYQLYTSTSMTPSQVNQTASQPPIAFDPPPTTLPVDPTTLSAAQAETEVAAPATQTAPAPADEMRLRELAAEPQFGGELADNMFIAPPPAPTTVMPMGAVARGTVPDYAVAPQAEASGDEFTSFEEQRLKVAASDPVSTFSIDVDTASYSYVRRSLEEGYVPEPDAVRIEELLNYFPYDYALAESATAPFKPTMAVFPTPWNPKTQLLEIGIKGYVPPAGEDKPSNLVFLIDTSGSMDEPDKLPLLQRAFGLLVDQLSANDTVSIITYAGSAGVVLEPTKAIEKAKILSALDQLYAGGSTAGAEGIELAYKLAEQSKVSGGTNRVILATDGDFNVGIDDPEKLEDFIKAKRDSGVTLSVLGFGMGNLDDATMQALAQNGDGNASYISSFREAQKVLVEEVGSTLHMIAKDVKIQVEFNPAVVSEYRLIGYETRALNREDFNNDAVDAGDIGAGHTVTALYEITPVGSGAELVEPLRYGNQQPAVGGAAGEEIAFLKMRYKMPDSDVSQLIEQAVTPSVVYGDISEVSDDARFAAAVAAFGQKLKGSDYVRDMSWADIQALAQSGKGTDESGYRAEFIQLLKTAALLQPDAAGDACTPDSEADGAC